MTLNLDKSTWKRFAFGDVIDNIANRVDNPSKAGVDRYVGLEHLDPCVMTVQRWGTPDEVNAQKLLFEPGDVIFGRRRAYQKKVARADFRGICSAHALVLRARPDFIHPDFLPVFLSSGYFLDRAIAISVGSLSPTVNWRDLKAQEFDLPPLDEQQRIADLLWAVSRHQRSLRDARNQCICLRESFVTAELGLDDRPIVRLGDAAAITSGITLGPARSVMPMSASYLRVANVQRNRLDLDEIKEAGVTESELGSKVVRRGDVLVVEGHASASEVGRAAIWDRSEAPLFQNHLFRIRALPSFRDRFLLEAINSSRGRSYISTVAKSTSGLNTINSTVLKALPVLLLSLEEQDAFLQKLGAIDSAASAICAEEDALLSTCHAAFAEVFGVLR